MRVQRLVHNGIDRSQKRRSFVVLPISREALRVWVAMERLLAPRVCNVETIAIGAGAGIDVLAPDGAEQEGSGSYANEDDNRT